MKLGLVSILALILAQLDLALAMPKSCHISKFNTTIYFDPILGTKNIRQSSPGGNSFVLKSLGNGTYKMKGRGRIVSFGAHSVTYRFLHKNVVEHFDC